MPRLTFGSQVQMRARRLLGALLDYEENKSFHYEPQLTNLDVNLQLINTHSPQFKLVVQTKIRALVALIQQDKHPQNLSKEQVREVLLCLKHLHLLSDNRTKTQGKEDWYFTLELWHTDKEQNLRQFDIEWEKRKSKQQITYLNKDLEQAPELSCFYGREDEIAKLEEWIVKDNCKLVGILGIGGVGKTYLSAKLGKGGIGKTDLSLQVARGIQDHFEYIIWRSLINAPLVEELLKDLIKFLSNQQETDFVQTLNGLLSRLLYYLRERRCLLILDNLETVLQGGELTTDLDTKISRDSQYIKGWEGYGELLKQIANSPHKSCLLLTSREKPQNIARFAGKNKPVRFLELGGLDYLDGQKIFADIADFSASDEEWKQLVKFYNGNPLALELAAHHISDSYCGDISEFLRSGKQVFDDLNGLLDWHFHRLSEKEKEIVYWLAISREPVHISELRDEIVSLNARIKLASTLQSLQRRLPLDKKQERFTLQPVLIEYITDKFINQVCQEIKTGNIALFNSHTLIQVQAKDYIKKNQINLIVEPIIDCLLTSLYSRIHIESKLKQIISKIQTETPLRYGYGGGNTINLLKIIEVDFSNYDFSSLTIWQADLRGVNLKNVDFSNSDLDKSVFTEMFGGVLSVAFSPDGQYLATGDVNGKLCIWEFPSGRQLLTRQEHNNRIWSVAFSPDGEIVSTSSSNGNIKLRNVKTNQHLKTLRENNSRVWTVAFNPQNPNILSSGSQDGKVRLWDVSTGKCFSVFSGHQGGVRSVSFSFDGKQLGSGSEDRTVKIWNVSTGECIKTLSEHNSQVWSVAFSPTHNQTVASGSQNGIIKISDVSTGECLRTFQTQTDNGVQTIAFNPNGQTLASGMESQLLQLWDVTTGQLLQTLSGHSDEIWMVDFSPDGNTLTSGSNDRTIKLWDVNTGQCIKTLQGYADWILSLKFSQDSKTIIGSSNDNTIRLWDINTGQCLKTLKGHSSPVQSIALSPSDGQTLASGSDKGVVKLWNLTTGECLHTLKGQTRQVWWLAFNPQGNTIASASSDCTVGLWDVNTGECLHILKKHTSQVWSVAFSPDGQILASSSEDGTVELWDVTTGESLKTLEVHNTQIQVWLTAFSLDGKTLSTASRDGTVKLWDIATGKCLKTLEGFIDEIWTVSFSPNNQTFVSDCDTNTFNLWNFDNGECLRTFKGHTSFLWLVIFSPDGKLLASCSQDETIKLWSVQTGECLQTLRIEKPYQGMDITNCTNLTEGQKLTLKALGAVERIQ